jgi:predicted RNA-binding Zn-ribbon protein involved in translation (DUF1610 family)
MDAKHRKRTKTQDKIIALCEAQRFSCFWCGKPVIPLSSIRGDIINVKADTITWKDGTTSYGLRCATLDNTDPSDGFFTKKSIVSCPKCNHRRSKRCQSCGKKSETSICYDCNFKACAEYLIENGWEWCPDSDGGCWQSPVTKVLHETWMAVKIQRKFYKHLKEKNDGVQGSIQGTELAVQEQSGPLGAD